MRWTSRVSRGVIAAATATRLLGSLLLVYTFGRVLDAAEAALSCSSDARGGENPEANAGGGKPKGDR